MANLPYTELVYCPETERWQTHGNNPKVIPYRCGDRFSIRIDGKFIPCRLELDRDWYVIFSDTKFYLHPRERYEICTF